MTVSDGRLDLRMHDDGGTNPHWVINGFDIANVPEPASALLLTAGPLLLRRRRARN